MCLFYIVYYGCNVNVLADVIPTGRKYISYVMDMNTPKMHRDTCKNVHAAPPQSKLLNNIKMELYI